MKKLLLVFLVFGVSALFAFSQSVDISGNLTMQAGYGLPNTHDNKGRALLGNTILETKLSSVMDESLVYVGGVPCWILEYTAKDAKAKVSRRVYWIGKENYVTYKGEMYNQKGELQKQLTCENISKVDGYWTTAKSTMTNVLTKHTTVYEIKDISYDKPVNANFFTVAALERGQVK